MPPGPCERNPPRAPEIAGAAQSAAHAIEMARATTTTNAARYQRAASQIQTQHRRIERLAGRRAQLDAAQPLLDAVAVARERKRRQRRAYLIGAYLLERASPDLFAAVLAGLDVTLERATDRDLFGL